MNKVKVIYFLVNMFFGMSASAFDAIFAVYLKENLGFSSSEVLYPFALMHVSIAILEVPTGVVGDRFGHLLSARLGLLFVGLSYCFFFLLGLAGNAEYRFVFIFGVILVFSLGWTLFSGSLFSWFVNKVKNEGNLSRVFSRLNLTRNTSVLIFSLYYGSLISSNVNVIWLISTALLSISLILILFVNDEKMGTTSLSYKSLFLRNINSFKENKKIVFFTLSQVSLYLLTAVMVSTLINYFKRYQHFFDFPLERYLWSVYIATGFLGTFFSNFEKARRSFKRPERLFIIQLFPVLLLACLTAFIETGAPSKMLVIGVVSVIYINKFGSALLAPKLQEVFQKLVVSDNERNTYNSIFSFLIEVFAGVSMFIIATFSNDLSINMIWLITSLISLVSFAVFWRRVGGV